jgi:hypothetical protein
LAAGIKDLVDKVFCGSAVRASLESGLARATVWNWLKGSRPSLSQLVQVCVHANADLVALFDGRYSPVSETGEGLSLSRKLADRPYVRTPLTDEQMSAALTEALDAAEAVSAAKVCARLGVDPKTARNRFPELTHRLGQRFLAASAEDGRRRFRAAQAAYVKAASDLQAEGKTVGAKNVQRRAGLVAFSLHPGRLRALNEAIAQVRPDARGEPREEALVASASRPLIKASVPGFRGRLAALAVLLLVWLATFNGFSPRLGRARVRFARNWPDATTY